MQFSSAFFRTSCRRSAHSFVCLSILLHSRFILNLALSRFALSLSLTISLSLYFTIICQSISPTIFKRVRAADADCSTDLGRAATRDCSVVGAVFGGQRHAERAESRQGRACEPRGPRARAGRYCCGVAAAAVHRCFLERDAESVNASHVTGCRLWGRENERCVHCFVCRAKWEV